MLPAYIPDLEIEVLRCGERDGSYVLANCGDGFEVRVVVGEGGFYLFEEGGFAGVVEAEEEDGVFC